MAGKIETADREPGVHRESPSRANGAERASSRSSRGTGEVSPESTAPRSGSNGSRSGGDLLVTPFGTFDQSVSLPRSVINVGAASEWETYFKTHQPSEWVKEEAAREKFAEIYGEKALTTLDWTGTVPDHVDPVWTLSKQIDSEGRPLPSRKYSEHKELS